MTTKEFNKTYGLNPRVKQKPELRRADRAGTKDPIWAMRTISATWRI